MNKYKELLNNVNEESRINKLVQFHNMKTKRVEDLIPYNNFATIALMSYVSNICEEI